MVVVDEYYGGLPRLLYYGLFGMKEMIKFLGDLLSLMVLVLRINLRLAKWALVRKEFSNFSLNAILLN